MPQRVVPQDEGTPWDRYGPQDDEPVDVRGCGCKSPACPVCNPGLGYRFAQQLLADCDRLRVEHLSMLTVTRDPSRFDDPDYVRTSGVVSRFMDRVWNLLPESYRERFGGEPLYWCAFEPHDGKRATEDSSGEAFGGIHAHILFPAVNARGWIGTALEPIRDAGIKMSGRTTYGWVRGAKSVYAVPVLSDKGKGVTRYLSKGLLYAFKGSGGLLDRWGDKVRLSMFIRSRGVSRGDPRNVCRRAKQDLMGELLRNARANVRRLRHEHRESSPEYKRALEVVASHERELAPRERRPMRTHAERWAECCSRSVVIAADTGRMLGHIPRPFTEVWNTCLPDLTTEYDPCLMAFRGVFLGQRKCRVPRRLVSGEIIQPPLRGSSRPPQSPAIPGSLASPGGAPPQLSGGAERGVKGGERSLPPLAAREVDSPERATVNAWRNGEPLPGQGAAVPGRAGVPAGSSCLVTGAVAIASGSGSLTRPVACFKSSTVTGMVLRRASAAAPAARPPRSGGCILVQSDCSVKQGFGIREVLKRQVFCLGP